MRVVIHLERTGFQCFAHAGRNELVGLFLHLATFLCKAYNLLTLVRVGFQCQPVSDVVHGLTVFLPKHHQNKVLRVGNTQFRQHRRVGLRNESCCRVETKAYLVVKL